MLAMVQALWRPLTGFVMSGVVLATALGWLPEGAEKHAESLLTTAGGVLAALTASRAVQRVQEVRAGDPASVADEIVERIRQMMAPIHPAVDTLGAATLPYVVLSPQKETGPKLSEAKAGPLTSGRA